MKICIIFENISYLGYYIINIYFISEKHIFSLSLFQTSNFMGINKNKDYCLRYFNAVTLYVSIVMTIASIVGTCVTWFVYMV